MHSPTPKRRPLVQVDRIIRGANGAHVSISLVHEAGRPGDALKLVDEAVRAVTMEARR